MFLLLHSFIITLQEVVLKAFLTPNAIAAIHFSCVFLTIATMHSNAINAKMLKGQQTKQKTEFRAVLYRQDSTPAHKGYVSNRVIK